MRTTIQLTTTAMWTVTLAVLAVLTLLLLGAEMSVLGNGTWMI